MKVEVSIGEVLDKVSILEIKLDKFSDSLKLANVRKEYNLLMKSMELLDISHDSAEFLQLKKVNLSIWNIEDSIRICEYNNNFGDEFIKLARGVYYENDKRAAIKRMINIKYNSLILEEKEYSDYGQDSENE